MVDQESQECARIWEKAESRSCNEIGNMIKNHKVINFTLTLASSVVYMEYI